MTEQADTVEIQGDQAETSAPLPSLPWYVRFWRLITCHYDRSCQKWEREDSVPTIENLDLGIQVGLAKLDRQMGALDALDTKIGLVLASSGILTGIIIAWKQPMPTFPGVARLLPGAAIICFLLIGLASVLGYWVKAYQDSPDSQGFRDETMWHTHTGAKFQTFDSILIATMVNEPLLELKAFLARCALVGLSVEILIGAYVLWGVTYWNW